MSIFFGKCWQIKNLNKETHLATGPGGGSSCGDHDVDKTQNLRKGSNCECSHQAHMNPYLFITFAPVRRCVDLALRCFVSTFTDRGAGAALQHLGKKITEATVFSKARKCAATAGMPGHLADIIFKMEISSGGRRGQSVCFPATSQA